MVKAKQRSYSCLDDKKTAEFRRPWSCQREEKRNSIMSTNKEIIKDIDAVIEEIRQKRCNTYHGFIEYMHLSHSAMGNDISINRQEIKTIPPSDELIKLLMVLRSKCHPQAE
jgi:hypothetical protein